MINILDRVPAEGDDVDMPERSHHCNPLESRLPIIRSSLQAFMRPIFPQDSLLGQLGPFKYCKVFVKCISLLDPQQGSTFHVHFQACLQSSKNQSDAALDKLFPISSDISLIWALCEGGLWKIDTINSALRHATQTLGCLFSPWAQWFSTTRPNIKRK
jgi:hypothetical protein